MFDVPEDFRLNRVESAHNNYESMVCLNMRSLLGGHCKLDVYLMVMGLWLRGSRCGDEGKFPATI